MSDKAGGRFDPSMPTRGPPDGTDQTPVRELPDAAAKADRVAQIEQRVESGGGVFEMDDFLPSFNGQFFGFHSILRCRRNAFLARPCVGGNAIALQDVFVAGR